MVAIEPGHTQTGFRLAASADYHSRYRAAANARATGFRHGTGYDSAGAAHGHACQHAARESGRSEESRRPAEGVA